MKRVYNETMKKIGNQTTERLLNIIKMQLTFLGTIFVMFIIVQYLFYPIQVDGKSMDPTLHHGDFGFANVFALKHESLEHFDVVIVKMKDEYWVKRVLALPGDTISCKENVIYVNQQPIQENYLDHEYVAQEIKEHGFFTQDFDEIRVNEGEVFLMGDNRYHSLDSRVVGTFQISDLVAKDIYIFWPLNHGKVVK